eukprot:scaffold4500_cov113-Isochrysis_galbana.AAC.1
MWGMELLGSPVRSYGEGGEQPLSLSYLASASTAFNWDGTFQQRRASLPSFSCRSSLVYMTVAVTLDRRGRARSSVSAPMPRAAADEEGLKFIGAGGGRGVVRVGTG